MFSMIQSLIASLPTSRREEGQAMVEYALVLVLVAVVGAATLTPLGTAVAAAFTTITGSL